MTLNDRTSQDQLNSISVEIYSESLEVIHKNSIFSNLFALFF